MSLSQPNPRRGRGRGRGGKGKGGRGGRSKTTGPLALGTDGADHCLKCLQIFTNEDDHMILCDRCDGYMCQKCAKLDDSQYEVLTKSLTNLHFYCENCEAPAIQSVLTDATIEEKCSKYCKKIEDRLTKVEKDNAEKADKNVVDSLGARLKKMEEDMKGLTEDISKMNGKIMLTRNEKDEKEKREMNLVIRGLEEKDDVEDSDLVTEIFDALSLPGVKFTKLDRLGAKPKPPAENQIDREVNDRDREQNNQAAAGRTGVVRTNYVKHRPLRVILESKEDKLKLLKKGPEIRNYVSENFNSKYIFILPDQTRLEREKDLALRRELKNVREANPNERFQIKKGKIVKKEGPQSQNQREDG